VSHLTAAQRGNIETLLQEKYTNKEIGKKLGKHPITIGREIVRGLGVPWWPVLSWAGILPRLPEGYAKIQNGGIYQSSSALKPSTTVYIPLPLPRLHA
jgi:hypothetical protein